MNLTEICAELKNYFPPANQKSDMSYIHKGDYSIKNGSIAPLDFLKQQQYFRIVGSDLNDGVYQNTPESLAELLDEDFTGAVWAMSVPRSFVKLCEDIDAWRKTNESADSANMSPFTSESFGGYSYSKSSGNSSSLSSGNSVTWQDQFSQRLNMYRRISVL